MVGGTYCTVCGNGKEAAEKVIPVIAHNTNGTVAHKDATCTATGVVGGTYCTACNDGKAAAEKVIPVIAHNTKGNVAHKDATCTATGVVGGTYCTVCGNGKAAAEKVIPVVPHNTKGVVEPKDATCTATGVVGGTYCTVCNEGKAAAEAAITAPGHNANGTVAHKDATCTATGVVGGTYCSACNDGKAAAEAAIAALGHSWQDATCTVAKTCAVCKATEGSAKGHNWTEATCTAAKTCKTCGVTEGDKIPHTFDQEKVDPKYLVSEATTTEQAVYKKSCKCGEAGTETFKYGDLKPSEPSEPSEPEVKPVVNFKDVSTNAFYYDPVMWAVQNKVTSGTGDGTTFSPDEICTRGQVVTFLWRAAGEPEPTKTENPFTDVKESDFFYKAVLWAVENKITNGTGDGTTFSPNENCNRGQIVTFLSRAKDGKATTSKNPFTDVAENAFYYDPVLWAVENKITTGTGDGTTFAPNEDCTRGQVITFLYRAYNK